MSGKHTRVIFGHDARNALFNGLKIVADSVSVTLGPRGRTVLVQQEGDSPIITKDGVTVSKSVNLKDPLERMGAQLIKTAASQTNETAGDGTTTATVLTAAMVQEGLKLLTAGYSSKDLCESIDSTINEVVDFIAASAKKLTTTEEITQIATISANGDRRIGEIIAEAMEKVGHDGIISVEDAKGTSTTLEVVDGMQFDRGYLSPYFVNNSEKMHAYYNDVRVLLIDHKLAMMKDLIPILEKTMAARVPLLIIAEEIEGEALQGLVVNRVNGNLPVVAIKSPGYGQHKNELLHDISVITGSKIVSSSTGMKLSAVTLADLGTLKKVVVDAKTTTLVSSGTSNSAVDSHISDLKAQMQDITLSSDELVKIRTRIAKLASGVAVIKVGGTTELEMIERKYRIEDALHATRAAVEGGIVPGGGMALFNAWRHIKTKVSNTPGESVVLSACIAPLRKIIENAGQSPDVVIADLLRYKTSITHTNTSEADICLSIATGNDIVIADLPRHKSVSKVDIGYNAATGEFVDMVASGIIDPALVTRTALKNAASVAITFLSLNAVIVEDS